MENFPGSTIPFPSCLGTYIALVDRPLPGGACLWRCEPLCGGDCGFQGSLPAMAPVQLPVTPCLSCAKPQPEYVPPNGSIHVPLSASCVHRTSFSLPVRHGRPGRTRDRPSSFWFLSCLPHSPCRRAFFFLSPLRHPCASWSHSPVTVALLGCSRDLRDFPPSPSPSLSPSHFPPPLHLLTWPNTPTTRSSAQKQ